MKSSASMCIVAWKLKGDKDLSTNSISNSASSLRFELSNIIFLKCTGIY